MHHVPYSHAKVAYEIKSELSDRKLLGLYEFRGNLTEAFRTFMEYVNEVRKEELYEHKHCHDECKARGCGVSFSIDGLWKIRFVFLCLIVSSLKLRLESVPPHTF